MVIASSCWISASKMPPCANMIGGKVVWAGGRWVNGQEIMSAESPLGPCERIPFETRTDFYCPFEKFPAGSAARIKLRYRFSPDEAFDQVGQLGLGAGGIIEVREDRYRPIDEPLVAFSVLEPALDLIYQFR